MVRWRCALVLGMLLLIPPKIGSKLDEDDDEDRSDENEEDEDEDEEEEEEEGGGGGGGPGATMNSLNKDDRETVRRRTPIAQTTWTMPATRTAKKRPLECYVCAYKSETPLRACLDPTKYRVHTIICHSAEDKCFTSVISKGNSYEAVVRGCRSGCVGSPETTCCELNRCNNQAFAMPVIPPRALMSKANKSIPPTILFFVSVLLVLQTVIKVPIF